MKFLKRTILTLLLTSFICVGTLSTSAIAADIVEQSEIEEIIAVAEVFGDGEKITAAILKYPKVIRPRTLTLNTFYVEGRTIESVYLNDKAEVNEISNEGNYIIIKFENHNTAYDGALSKKPNKKIQSNDQGKPKGDAPMFSDRQLPNLSLNLKQIGTLIATDGTIFLPNNQLITADIVKADPIDSFKQFTYTDVKTGLSMPYNLFLPKNYDSNKKYPLVLFIADASANINEVTTPLFQGNGATIWATDEEQAKNECIVLAPQYTRDLIDQIGMMTTDENKWTPGLNLVTNLLFDVINNYSVDENRIYGTGQSQGGMANIAISDKYPDLFAAQYLVACQWNVDEMEILKNKNLWITVCQGDTKAFPGMNAAVDRWTSLGAKVARNKNFFDSKDSIEKINKKVQEIIDQNANINYTVFKDGNHMYTWTFAYNIDLIRDWLFKHSK